MERDYFGHVRVLAGVNYHAVYQQDLEILRSKYHLSDKEMEEIIQHCREQKITIYDAAKECISNSKETPRPKIVVAPLTEEEKEHRRMAEIVSFRIDQLASKASREKTPCRGWICGTYANRIRKIVAEMVREEFTSDELRFIINHLPTKEETQKATVFDLKDPEHQKLCDALSDRLNKLIPELHVNLFYGDDDL